VRTYFHFLEAAEVSTNAMSHKDEVVGDGFGIRTDQTTVEICGFKVAYMVGSR